MAIAYSQNAKEIIIQKLTREETPTKAELSDDLHMINLTAVNSSARPISKMGLKRKLLYGFKAFIRKLVFWYVEPCLKQQSEYNVANGRFASEIYREVQDINRKSEKMDQNERRIAALNAQMTDFLAEAAERENRYQRKIEELERQIATLSAKEA